jgi:hypothetical protein
VAKTHAGSVQYEEFKAEAAQDGMVYTFTKDGEYLIYPLKEREALLFWSSKSRIQKIQKSLKNYSKYEISELSLPEFLDWLPELSGEGIGVGANWTGKPLVGYDVSAMDLIAGLKHLVKRQSVK